MIEIDRPAPPRALAPAKLRILETADLLFYDEGIRAVGVDRLISASSVTKATFYKHYGSKDRLIVDYVDHRHRVAVDELADLVERHDDPEEVLRAVQAGITTAISSPDFRGCPFINAASEFFDPDHPVRRAVVAHRDWYVAVLEQLLRAVGHPLAGDAADDLMLARDGAMAGGYAGDPVAASAALARAFDRALADAHR
ncbi:TetR/AcrR family transcriptional regulator [Lysinimonas soli]|uniref:TetR/AcrR family transcriptional regulator n=1 Tax=Lysinimonas soli TaxID=1074233 RepID=A0ABW0NQ17_9MICO